jgi:hypothetical protein
MELSIEMNHALALINNALLKEDDLALEKAFEGVDLIELLSSRTITVVRRLGNAPLVLLLCTLAEHNGVEVSDAKRWLAAYQSIARRQLDPDLVQLSKRHVRRLAVETLISQQSLVSKNLDFDKLKGSSQDWQDALEILIDHKDWHSACTVLQLLGDQLAEKEILGRIAHSLSSRHSLYVEQSGIAQVDVDYRVLATLYQLCANAAKQAKVLDLQQALMHLSASALEIAGDHLAAVRILDSTDKQRDSLDVQLDASRCLCKHGDLLESIARLDRMLELLVQKKESQSNYNPADLKVNTSQLTRPGADDYKETFDLESANKALSDLSAMANAKGSPIFLVSGTLLGCIREGQLLSHDKDIDVGIVGWENQYELCMALQESGLFTVAAQYLKGQDTYYIPICHNATGIWIDIFVYHPQGQHWVTGVDFFFGYRQTFAFTPFALKQVEFLGVNMNIPADAALNLTENYGKWEKPDPSYITHLESPSTMNKGGLAYMLTARLAALSAVSSISTGSTLTKASTYQKLSKVLFLMREHQHFPGGMDEPLLGKLMSLLTLEAAISDES